MTYWLRPTKGLTLVFALRQQRHTYGFGWNWRGHVWGVWHDVGTAWYRWHFPPALEAMSDPPEGFEWGVADNGALIHVPIQ